MGDHRRSAGRRRTVKPGGRIAVRLTRRVVQLGFLALTLAAVFVVGANAERWCPFGGVEALYTYLHEGNLLCSLGISNFYILAAVLVTTLLLRRVFCGYMCPIGTLSEWIGRGAARCKLRPRTVPPGADRALSLLKYAVLGVILFITYRASELLFRGFDPCYALLSRHGEDITFWAYVVAGAIVIGSVFVTMPFCRWLCPLAAVLNPFSRVGLTRIRRNTETCIDCGKCSRVCPMAIPVDTVREVTAARCMSCMECVEACPPKASGSVTWGPPANLGRRWPQAALVVIMLACVGVAVTASYAFPIASFRVVRGQTPARTESVQLTVTGLHCRGSATSFAYYLERDDAFAIPGYLKIEAWPSPGGGKARITFDPSQTNAQAIKQAITEAYFDATGNLWRPSPFEIEGYDPLAAPETTQPAGSAGRP
jgi:ferredoxin